ncbi:hypothetical protein QR680_010844 [Steinernema hermaphroditum]|uniref:C2H2-type domain-containing protein n=1 Tax=Steinernema hermaphroditum TaxID=289476 RepID=A0AA39IS33_9BILA|nr:hypothetical protein QR680_010844 [Steinernema hermaphroditum]
MHHSSSSSRGGSSPKLENAMVNAYKERITEYESDIEKLWKELEEAKAELAKRDDEEKDWLSKERGYEMRISTLKSTNHEIIGMGEALQDECKKLMGKVAERDKTIDQKNTAIESENDELKDMLALCTSAAAERDAERRVNKLLTDTCKLLQSEVSSANAILSEKTAKREQALQRVAALKAELMDQKDEMGVLVQGVRELVQKALSREVMHCYIYDVITVSYCASRRHKEFLIIAMLNHLFVAIDESVGHLQQSIRALHKRMSDFLSRMEQDSDSESECSDSDESMESDALPVKKPRRTIWKCRECETTIRGQQAHRLYHVSGHENLKVECPLDECDMLMAITSVSAQLLNTHNKTIGSLRLEEKDPRDRDRKECLRKASGAEGKYFTLGGFVEGIEEQKDPSKCKKCGEELGTSQGKRDHIAVHLKLKIPCPVGRCDQLCHWSGLARHLKRIHKKKISSLDKHEQKRLEEAREAYKAGSITDSVLEAQRHLHEERERLVDVITNEFLLDVKTNKERINSAHRSKQMIERYEQCTDKLLSLYEDEHVI